jgi:hypothetical protein
MRRRAATRGPHAAGTAEFSGLGRINSNDRVLQRGARQRVPYAGHLLVLDALRRRRKAEVEVAGFQRILVVAQGRIV